MARIFGGTMVVPKGRVVAVIGRAEGQTNWWLFADFFYDFRPSQPEDVFTITSSDDLEKTVSDVKSALLWAVGSGPGASLREVIVDSDDPIIVNAKLAAIFREESFLS